MHDAQERRVVVWRTGVLCVCFGRLVGVSSCQILLGIRFISARYAHAFIVHRRLLAPPVRSNVFLPRTQIEMEARNKFGLGGRVRFNEIRWLAAEGLCGFNNRLVSTAVGVDLQPPPPLHRDSVEALS